MNELHGLASLLRFSVYAYGLEVFYISVFEFPWNLWLSTPSSPSSSLLKLLLHPVPFPSLDPLILTRPLP